MLNSDVELLENNEAETMGPIKPPTTRDNRCVMNTVLTLTSLLLGIHLIQIIVGVWVYTTYITQVEELLTKASALIDDWGRMYVAIAPHIQDLEELFNLTGDNLGTISLSILKMDRFIDWTEHCVKGMGFCKHVKLFI